MIVYSRYALYVVQMVLPIAWIGAMTGVYHRCFFRSAIDVNRNSRLNYEYAFLACSPCYPRLLAWPIKRGPFRIYSLQLKQAFLMPNRPAHSMNLHKGEIKTMLAVSCKIAIATCSLDSAGNGFGVTIIGWSQVP